MAVEPTDIVITDLTNGSLDIDNEWTGTGIFDVLMNVVNKNIESQYSKGRITGSDYATVYLGALQAVLAQSVEYVMKEKITEAQVDNMVADTGFKDREITVAELNAEKQRSVMDKDIELKNEQITSERLNQNATKAKVEDEFGAIITDQDDGKSFSSSPETKHHWTVLNLEQQKLKSEQDVLVMEQNVESSKLSNLKTEASIKREYDYDIVNNLLEEKNSVNPLTFNVETFVPTSSYGIEILKAKSESKVAENTAKGYTADAYYKTYRSLQELLFALTNAGLIDQTNVPSTEVAATGTYGRIITGMEKAMNDQLAVWGKTAFIDLNGNGTVES